MKYYLFWVPGIIIYYAIFYWLTKKNNDTGGWWMWATYIFGALCPFWIYMTRYSKNLILDGFLYDIIMFFTFVITMSVLGAADKFTSHQWLGVGLVAAGFLLIRAGWS